MGITGFIFSLKSKGKLDTRIEKNAINSPILNVPESPINILAGDLLNNKKPSKHPIAEIANIISMYCSFIKNTNKKHNKTYKPTRQESPSNPSIKL